MTKATQIPDIYLDNHATTRVDPRVVQAMLPWLGEWYANPGSVTHEAGRAAKATIDQSVDFIAEQFGVSCDDLVVTSGATESINLAILGTCLHPRQKRRKIVSLATEHQAVLGPLDKLAKAGFEVVLLNAFPHRDQPTDESAGLIDLNQLEKAVDSATALVTVMLANNEIGVVQPIREIAKICQRHGTLLHTDATQAVGRIATDARELDVDLLSFSAHKFYGPKGVGGLIMSRERQFFDVAPQIVGGGQQHNLRSGTLNSTGIIGMTKALELANAERIADGERIYQLREKLWQALKNAIPGVLLNGAIWSANQAVDLQEKRLAGNLNVCFPKVDGQSLMLEIPRLAVSSGSACTSANPEPSHVLRALGRTEDQARASIRFGIGRFNTDEEVDLAAQWIIDAYYKLVPFVA